MGYYDSETKLERSTDQIWNGQVSAAWNIGDNPNGGYLVAIVLGAMRELVPDHPDPLSVTTHYLRTGIPDAPCEVRAEIVRPGRTLSTCRATLLQDGKARIEVLAAMGNLGAESAPETVLTIEAPSIPGPESCPSRSGAEQGVDLPLLERMDIRIHPDQAAAGAAGRAEVSGWIRFADDMPADSRAAVTFADAFPPSLFGLLGVIGWMPTVELTVHVRRRPAPGWILGRFTTDDLRDGRMVESGALWDATGNLIAQSRQIALLLKATN